MIAFARDARDKKYRAACRQLIGERNGKRFLRQLRVSRASQCVVIILFFLDARRLQAKLVKPVPGFLVSVTPDHRKDSRPKIGRKRCWICQVFFKALATAGDNLLVIQISQSAD